MAVDTTTQVTMPAMGESVTEGTVLEWHKQEGDAVEVGEVLVEISTDKVDAEVPSPAAGTLLKIHAPEGETVNVGALLAEIAPNGAGGGNGAGATKEAREGASGEFAQATSEALPKDVAEIVDITTPAGGESVTEGTILEWTVKVGDAVSDGDTVVEISTDKVDMELPAPAAGTITEILAEEGETVTVGQVIARMALGADGASAAPAEAAPAAPAAPAPVQTGENVTPVAARVAAAEGVDLSTVTGTGPRGRITKADVLNGGNGATAAAAPTADAQPLK